MKKHFFVFDVESVGLHGEGFAVAGGVYGGAGICYREFMFRCDPDNCAGSEENRKWIRENVPGFDNTHDSSLAMRQAFWDLWLDAKEQYPGIVMAAECGWPVEARFLCACIDDDTTPRQWQGPYPLHDIATLMLAAGMDPMASYPRLENELPAHLPLADVRQSARLLFEAMDSTPY